MKPEKQRRQLAVELFGPEVGCGASVCVFGRADGMANNGPCQCRRDPRTHLRLSIMVAKLLERQAVQS
jgi:hypothetical protein